MSEVELFILAEIYLAKILGSTLLYSHGTVGEKRWKAILGRISTAIEKAVKQNVITDNFHKSELEKYITGLKEACKKKECYDPSIILSLVSIIFELLGGAPDYTSQRRMNRNDDYVLTSQRKLQYFQSPYQRVKTILRASRENAYSKFHKHDDLFNEFALTFRSDAEEFLKWYKKKYPKVYLMIF